MLVRAAASKMRIAVVKLSIARSVLSTSSRPIMPEFVQELPQPGSTPAGSCTEGPGCAAA